MIFQVILSSSAFSAAKGNNVLSSRLLNVRLDDYDGCYVLMIVMMFSRVFCKLCLMSECIERESKLQKKRE